MNIYTVLCAKRNKLLGRKIFRVFLRTLLYPTILPRIPVIGAPCQGFFQGIHIRFRGRAAGGKFLGRYIQVKGTPPDMFNIVGVGRGGKGVAKGIYLRGKPYTFYRGPRALHHYPKLACH
jgi:hypothetical protein